ncbi:AAA-ATPase-like protein [Tanacetum coccineum]|uniref:AAA-ATPase-like protein n=1 Tax=Tanacetum coccineum TaxID=301880 RepID=A0ABQ5AF03_9ASTR
MNELILFHLYLTTLQQRNNKRKNVKLLRLISSTDILRYGNLDLPLILDHPSNFATLAMDPDVKEKVMKDLDRFVARREYYRIGKAWKRGYLLYGPPGTGNRSNSELRRLLVSTANRSILVVEDIDCSVQLHDRDIVEEAKTSARKKGGRDDDDEATPKITLSGFLNFIDGLWSSCGDERIIIFTTNRKDKLDPALLRPGRMVVHNSQSYCTPSGFHLLASNYHNLTQHNLFEEIENLIRKVEITPAEVAEHYRKDETPVILRFVAFIECLR